MFTIVKTKVQGLAIQPGEVQKITCSREGNRWSLVWANYMVKKSQRAYTEIAAITDEFIAWMSRKRKKFTVLLHNLPFEGARMLVLDELCTGPEGGAWYRMPTSRVSHNTHRLWVCDTSLLAFGDFPHRIFFRRGSNKQG